MRSDFAQFLTRALVAGLLVAGGTGCGEQTAPELEASAVANIEKGQLAKASVELRRALQLAPQSAQARLLLGQVFYRSGDYNSAELELQKVRAVKHADDQTIPLLAHVMLARGQFKRLVDDFQSTQLTDPTAHADLKVSIATAQASLGALDRAREIVAAVLQRDKHYAPALLLRARLTASGGGNLAGAQEEVRGVTAREPKNPDAWMLLGNLKLASADLPGAGEAFEAVLKLSPTDARAFSSLVAVHLRQKDIKAATATHERMAKAIPGHPRTKLVAAQLAELRGDLPKARELAQQLMQVAPDDVWLLQFTAGVYAKLGALSEAEAMLKKALLRDPTLDDSRALLAQVHMKSGQADKAVKVLQPALERPAPSARVLNLAGQASVQLGDLAAATKLFERAQQAKPGDVSARTALALIWVTEGQTDRGLAQLQSIAQSGSETAADLALITVLLRNNDIPAALRAIEVLDKKDPSSVTAAELRGRAYLARGDAVNARKAFEDALVRGPGYFPAVLALVNIDADEGGFEAAQRRLEAHLKTAPKDAIALRALTELRIRAGAERDEVVQRVAAAVAANPVDPQTRLQHVDYLIAQKSYKAAITAAQDAIAVIPDDATLVEALGRAQMLSGDISQAIISMGKLAQLNPGSAQPYLRLADVYVQAGNDEAAISTLRRALTVTPALVQAQAVLIKQLIRLKRHAEALAVAKQMQKERPGEPIGYLMEADIRHAQRDLDAAYAVLKVAMTKSPAGMAAVRYHSMLTHAKRDADARQFASSWMGSHPQDRQFLVHLGDSALARGDLLGAEQRFLELEKIDPRNAAVLNNIAWLQLQQKKSALAYAQRAVALAPNNSSLVDTLAHALAADKQPAKALEAGRRAISLAPANQNLRLSVAEAFLAAGETAAARQELELLSKVAPRGATVKTQADRLLASLNKPAS